MNLAPHRARPRCRAAFTLIELLLVISIIGVLVAVVLPQLSVGMSGVRVRTAVMGYMQSARYARTMALLYQVEVEIACETGGVMRVQAGPNHGEQRGPYVAPDDTESQPDAAGGALTVRQQELAQQGLRAPASNANSRLLSLPAAGSSALDQSGVDALAPQANSNDVSAEELAAAGDVSTAIRVEQKFAGVHLQFLEYTDEAPEAAGASDTPAETESFHVRYRSNGTCRPYRLRIFDDAGVSMTLAVDMLGASVVEGEGEE